MRRGEKGRGSLSLLEEKVGFDESLRRDVKNGQLVGNKLTEELNLDRREVIWKNGRGGVDS